MQTRLFERSLGGLDGELGPRQNHLVGAVVVGDHHLQLELVQFCAQLVDGRGHRQHAAGHIGRGGHQLAPLARRQQEVPLAEHTGRMQRAELTEAVTGHGLGLHLQLRQHLKLRETHSPDGGLGPVGPRQALLLGGSGLIIESRRRKHHLVYGQVATGIHGRQSIPAGACHRAVLSQSTAHLQVLAALSREDQGQAAVQGGAAEIDAVWGGEGFSPFQERHSFFQLAV